MTTEAPDGPMPLCFSPESFRAAVDRAKKAERERDEALANVATLVEQLGEAERRRVEMRGAVEDAFGCITVGAIDSDIERASLLARLAQKLGASMEKFDACPECGSRSHPANLCLLGPDDEDDDGATLAGAAQPVVEPRDETVLPERKPTQCGFTGCRVRHELARWAEESGIDSDYFDALLDELLHAHVDERHRDAGYAPHPSGTEGPLRKMLQDTKQRILRTASRTVPEPARSQWLEITDGIDAALAASPPDGTAPAMDQATRAGYRYMVEQIEAFDAKRQDAGVTLSRIHTELKRGLSESGKPPAHRPDVTAPERAPKCAGVYNGCEFRNGACRHCGEPAERDEGATRPPDGMPGEPACTCHAHPHAKWCGGSPPSEQATDGIPGVPPTDGACDERARDEVRRKWAAGEAVPKAGVRHHGTRSDGKWGCDACCNGDRCDDATHVDRRKCGVCKGSGAIPPECLAAPPTVPGEPPSDCGCVAARLLPRVLYNAHSYLDTLGAPKGEVGSPLCSARMSERFKLLAAPPTPPLTPERAPADERVWLEKLVKGAGELDREELEGALAERLYQLERAPERAPLASKSAAKCSVTAGHGIHVCVQEDGHDGDHVWDFEVDDGRAPLDEAAVRADERRRLREQLIRLRRLYGDERAVAFNTITAVGEELFGERMPPGPRRSEGAG